MSSSETQAPTPPVGVIESLSRGFDLVAKKYWLLLIPLVLDVFLWLGPRITFQPAMNIMLDSFVDVWEPILSSHQQGMYTFFLSQTEGFQESINALQPQYLPLYGVPSIITGREAIDTNPGNFRPYIITANSPREMFGLFALSIGISLVFSTGYALQIANSVRPTRQKLTQLARRYVTILSQFVVLAVFVPLLILVFYLPFLLVTWRLLALSEVMNGFMGIAVGRIANLIGILGLFLILWLATFAIFTGHGILLNQRNIIEALWDSIRVVQWNMSATLFLLLIIVVIDGAMRALWFTANPDSALLIGVSIIGNAFISTGLIAATFIFFDDRHRYWQELRTRLVTELERRRSRQESAQTRQDSQNTPPEV